MTAPNLVIREGIKQFGNMTTPKKRGTSFEYRVAYLLEGFGFSWDRSGSSLGIDLKISKKGRLVYLISCKKTSKLGPIYLPRAEVERLKASAKETGAEGLVCFGFMRTPVLAIRLEEISKLPSTRLYYKIQLGDGKPLKDMLKTADF
jgi:Holliday junction resolvase